MPFENWSNLNSEAAASSVVDLKKLPKGLSVNNAKPDFIPPPTALKKSTVASFTLVNPI